MEQLEIIQSIHQVRPSLIWMNVVLFLFHALVIEEKLTFNWRFCVTKDGYTLNRKRFVEEGVEASLLSTTQQQAANGTLTCAVGSMRFPAQLLSNTTVMCSLGGPFSEGSSPVQVLWNNGALHLPVDVTFMSTVIFIHKNEMKITSRNISTWFKRYFGVNIWWTICLADCEARQRCQQCSSSAPFCGWCLEENQCTTEIDCTATWVPGDCPTLFEINPAVGVDIGGEQVTLTGKHFINHPAIHIKFGDSFTNATFVSNDTVTFLSSFNNPHKKKHPNDFCLL